MIAILAALAIAANASGIPPVMKSHKLRVGRSLRTFFTYVPAHRTSPLTVISLHGLGGQPKGFVYEAKLKEAAEQRGFLLVAPQFAKGGFGARDFAFLRALKRRIVKDFGADPRLFFAVGASNGGRLALVLACEPEPLFRGYAAVLAHLGKKEAKACRPKAPVALLHMYGGDDPIVTYSGEFGKAIAYSSDPTETLGAEGTDSLFASHLGCGTPVTESLVDRDPADGTAVERRSYPCPGGSVLRSVNVKGAGHTWAGGSQYLPESLVGRVSKEFSATAECLDFFEGLKLP